jgi:hypothetical protein
MAAVGFRDGYLPNLNNFDIKNRSEEYFFSWLGSSRGAVKKLYQEEIKSLMPKAKPLENTGKADEEKPSGKKTAVKKPAKAKAKK